MNGKRIILAVPRSFCAGVKRAINIAETAVRVFPPPIYCLKEIVHNRQVVKGLRKKGIVFVRDIDEVPEGAAVLFSAHGVPPEVRQAAEARRLNIVDATCPFVTKVHAEVRRYAQDGFTILLIGDRGHDEIVGVAGEAPERVIVIGDIHSARTVAVPDPRRVAVVTQTTLSAEERSRTLEILRERFADLRTPPSDDICYATRNRQKAVAAVVASADLVLVLGSENSSNSRRLVKIARNHGGRAALIDDVNTLENMSLDSLRTIGLTAGASTPESCVRDAIRVLQGRGFRRIEEVKVAEENLDLALPHKLQALLRDRH